MSVAFNSATAANIAMLQSVNSQFQVAQKRVSTGKAVFGAADDATRYRMSDTMLGRAKSLDAINNNISLALKTLETTDKTLASVINLVNSAQTLTRKAQAEGAAATRSAQTTANVQSTTQVTGLAINSTYNFSITSDSGQNFTYTFSTGASTSNAPTWGTIVDALNSANIGVQATFEPSTTAGAYVLKFSSTNNKDFRFDGKTSELIMDDLVGIATGTGSTTTLTAVNAASYFANTTAAPTANETGFTVSYGGAVVGTSNIGTTTNVATGSSLVFVDGNGQTKTYSNSTSNTNLGLVIADFNSQFQASGVLMEIANVAGGAAGVLRIRNTNGGSMQILAGIGGLATNAGGGTVGLSSIPTTGYAAPLSTNNSLRLSYGQQYDAIINNINQMIANNPVQNGRNLLKGENLGVVLDEFAGNTVTVAGANISGTVGTSVNNALGFTNLNGGTTWTTDTAIQASATATNTALTIIRDLQTKLATYSSYMQDRYDVNKTYGTDMKTLGDDLVAADVAEESAKLTALQTQQQFAVQAFTAGTQNAQGLLRLLG